MNIIDGEKRDFYDKKIEGARNNKVLFSVTNELRKQGWLL